MGLYFLIFFRKLLLIKVKFPKFLFIYSYIKIFTIILPQLQSEMFSDGKLRASVTAGTALKLCMQLKVNFC